MQKTDARGKVSNLEYYPNSPNLKRTLQPALSNGSRATINYNYNSRGQITYITDPEGRVTKNNYDSAGKLTKTTADSGSGRLNLSTNFSYDAIGNIQTTTDPKGNTTEYSYDSERRLLSTESPAPYSYLTELEYDKNGRIIEQRTETGDALDPIHIVQSKYTRADKLKKIISAEGYITQFEYDDTARLIKTIDAENRISENEYYDDGRLYRQYRTLNGTKITVAEYDYTANGQTSYLEDVKGNRSVLIYPDGYTLNYSYDALNRLERIDEINPQTQNLTTLANYDYIDRLHTQLSYANGISLSYESTIGGQLRHLEHLKNNNTLVSYDLLHNKVGELINRNISGTDYDWQPNSEQSTDYTSNELNQYDSIKFALNSYDDNGNFIDDNNGTSYSYDKENRMTAAITPQHNITYAYDAYGRRIQKVTVHLPLKKLQ